MMEKNMETSMDKDYTQGVRMTVAFDRSPEMFMTIILTFSLVLNLFFFLLLLLLLVLMCTLLLLLAP